MVGVLGLFGLTSKAATVTVGTNSCSNSSRFGASSTLNLVTPVRLPLGWLRLLTRPILTGSPPTVKAIGIVVVAFCAANATGVLVAAIIATWWLTASSANAGRRS